MKTAIYLRVSTNRQTQAQTIEQHLELFRYCTGRCRQRQRSVPSFFMSGMAEPYIGA